MLKYIVVETKEEKRCVKSKKTAATANQVEKRFWEEEEEACDRRIQEAEDDALNSWKNNRRLWRGSEVDKEMALLRERVKMRQMQEKLRLVTQPVIQEVEANMVEEDQRIISEDISRDDSISSTQSQSVQPVEIEQCLEESYPSGTFKPNNHFMNTPPATASKTICSRQRMERGMASLEAILKDIIEAVKVAWNECHS